MRTTVCVALALLSGIYALPTGLKQRAKANLNTDGALNLGVCTLHSAEMLTGGFNWIALGFIIDLILEWKPDLMKAITDEVFLSKYFALLE